MYEAFYNLAKKPFQLNPDPEFFYNSAVHKRALAYLRYGLAQGEGFIVVTGAPGTGKTMLVKALFEELKNENIVAGLMVTTHVDAEDTLRIVAASFGLPHEGVKASLIKGLEDFFTTKVREGKRILLVVDEAQNLPTQSLEELRMLSNFESNGKPMFQSFMLGQDQFRKVLQKDVMEQVRQRVTATYSLRPLESKETKPYILHRLKTAGWKKDPELKEEVFEAIYRYSQGVPRIINSLCDRVLLYGFLEEMHTIDGKAVRTVIQEIETDERMHSDSTPKRSRHNEVSDTSISVKPVEPRGTLEERVQYLEASMENLRKTLGKERALLRKAILLQLDMDDVPDSDEDYMDS